MTYLSKYKIFFYFLLLRQFHFSPWPTFWYPKMLQQHKNNHVWHPSVMSIWAKENTSTARYQSFSVRYAMCRLLSMRSNPWRMKTNYVINAMTRNLPARLPILRWKRGNAQNVMTRTNHPTSSCCLVRGREWFLKCEDVRWIYWIEFCMTKL